MRKPRLAVIQVTSRFACERPRIDDVVAPWYGRLMARRGFGWQHAPGIFLVALFAACFGGEFIQGLPCASDADCGPNLGCIEGLCGGPGESSVCGNALVEQGEDCDDGNTIDGDGCSSSCDRCGDGTTQSWEECDDGNTAEHDACTPACRFPTCGDGYQAPAEVCDDGNSSGTDDCTPACELPTCNDGFVNVAGEVCDDGNLIETDDCTTECTESPQTPTLELTLAQVKQFQFSWEPALGAETYQLLEDLGDGFEPVGGDIAGESVSRTMPLHLWTGGSYKLRACKHTSDCAASEALDVEGNLAEAIGHFKASNTGVGDRFGSSVAISRDGSVLAVGAPNEDSSAMGIDGDQDDDSLQESGAVYVFVYDGESWSQEAYIKASNPMLGAWFGSNVALSADGSTLAVTAPWAEPDLSGAAYVFVRDGGVWSEQEQVGPASAGVAFGVRLALSDDGDTLAVSAGLDASAATGIDGDPSDTSASHSGAVYVFARDEADAWSQEAYVKASNTGPDDLFGGFIYVNGNAVSHGGSVVLSADGNTMAVSAHQEDSAATGIDGDQDNDTAFESGAVYVFERSAGSGRNETTSRPPTRRPATPSAGAWRCRATATPSSSARMGMPATVMPRPTPERPTCSCATRERVGPRQRFSGLPTRPRTTDSGASWRCRAMDRRSPSMPRMRTASRQASVETSTMTPSRTTPPPRSTCSCATVMTGRRSPTSRHPYRSRAMDFGSPVFWR